MLQKVRFQENDKVMWRREELPPHKVYKESTSEE
jgi:hypothetical protein